MHTQSLWVECLHTTFLHPCTHLHLHSACLFFFFFHLLLLREMDFIGHHQKETHVDRLIHWWHKARRAEKTPLQARDCCCFPPHPRLSQPEATSSAPSPCRGSWLLHLHLVGAGVLARNTFWWLNPLERHQEVPTSLFLQQRNTRRLCRPHV